MKRVTENRVARANTGRIFAFAGIATAVAGIASPALAAGSIDNSAVAAAAVGETSYVSVAAAQSVPLADPVLAIAVSSAGLIDDGGDGRIDPGDTISFTVSVTNKSNVTISGVMPGEAGIAFADVAGAGSFGAFSPSEPVEMVPGAAQDFTVVYTLAAEDIYRVASVEDGIVTSVKVNAKGPHDTPLSGNGVARNTIPARPELTVAKSAVLKEENGDTGDKLAEAGDTITYTYVVTNTGNVPLEKVKIVDTHEGAKLDSSAVASSTEGPFDETVSTDDPLGNNADEGVNGIYDKLGAGGSVTFTYVHTVTQAEFDAQ